MKRCWIGFGLLALFLALGLWVTVQMDSAHGRISQELRQAAEQTLAGDPEQGILLAQQARKHWEDARRGTACVADHEPMDEIDSLFARLEVYARRQQISEFAACCARLSSLVQAMTDAHGLQWWNLL